MGAATGVEPVPKPQKNRPGARKQYNVGFPAEDVEGPDGIDEVAATLGLEPTQFLRMVVRENMEQYRERARNIRHRKKRPEA